MIARYSKPPYQPKWMLQVQIFLLRHLKSAFNKQTMIITTTGRKTGHQHSVPINFIHDGSTYIAINLGARSNWYLNALWHPRVTLEVGDQKFDAIAKPVSAETPDEVRDVLDVFARERPDLYKRIFGLTYKTPSDEDVLRIQKHMAFIRFCPVQA